MTTLISADNQWVMWAVACLIATGAIYLEQTYKWASRISGPAIVILVSIGLANLKVIPDWCGVYDVAWTYLVPLSITMFMFKANVKKIFKSAGKMFISFNVTAVATIVGGVILFFVMNDVFPNIAEITGMSIAGGIGGSANELAVASSLNVPENMIIAYVAAVNIAAAPIFFLHAWLPSNKTVKKFFSHPFEDALDKKEAENGSNTTRSAEYWRGKEISLLDIGKTLTTAWVISAGAGMLADFLKGALAAPEDAGLLASIPSMLLGNQFVLITVFLLILVPIFPNFFENLNGAQEMGTFMLYIFFVAIGGPGNIRGLMDNALAITIYSVLLFTFAILVSLIFGKIFKLNLEEIMIACNANVGGPSTAAAIAAAKGYDELVTPGILCGLWGMIIGTPIGLLMFTFLQQYI